MLFCANLMHRDFKTLMKYGDRRKVGYFCSVSLQFQICVEISITLDSYIIFLEFFLVAYSKIVKRQMYLDINCSIFLEQQIL